MDSAGEADANNTSISESNSKLPTIYFGVYIPNEQNDGSTNVFEDKESALKLAKKHKKSRFKSFQFYHKAVDFSTKGYEGPTSNSLADKCDSEKKDVASPVGEKSSPFRTPRPQELTDFRANIEKGHAYTVRTMIDYNPRYLVSSGDTPSILQEGARLNALHVSAKAKNAEITEYILSTINNPEFIKRLYGDENQDNADSRCKMLLDLYLNTPNKGFNDTPLHIASKWGADTVVEVLLSYPECDKFKKNRHNKLAQDVICERADAKTPVSVKKKIQELLSDNYYVPILRTEDNTYPPLIGEPFSPTTPTIFNNDPLSPRLEIHAYAGPMDLNEANVFRKKWRTPPRSLNFNSPNSGRKSVAHNLNNLRLKDPQKGLERVGKNLADDFNVSWKEYWGFLDCFVDISSEEGLDRLETYLKSKEQTLQVEELSPILSQADSAVSPITNLCEAFSACKIDDSNSDFCELERPVDCRPLIYVDKACQVFANRIVTSDLTILRCSEREYANTLKSLETDIKLLELLINSYMTEDRFAFSVNFQKMHSRLAHLIACKALKNYNDCKLLVITKLEIVLDSLGKRSDYFSSDDESTISKNISPKPTMYRHQVICVLTRIKSILEFSPALIEGQDDLLTMTTWKPFEMCNCVFHTRKPKRNILSRNGSHKLRKLDLQSVSKKLCFGEELETDGNLVGANGDLGLNINSDESSKSDSDDEFYTPPMSPSKIRSSETSDSEEQFTDAELPQMEMFLEGSFPTKTDYMVFEALRYANCEIDRMKYPTVYKWRHSISLYRESEREAWPSPHNKNETIEPQSPKPAFSSPKPWLRITGANSPRLAIKSMNKRGNR
ncbi:hypothetical protein HUJ04_010625 [Dendroctonus ponderosae]|uniref:ANKLE2 third alpha/beta domain-containing protein n=1 Tax=Dendroctonus ponderosae TaxID=77166 RepID=A0AAR5Q9Q0_DENPD|nr:hypothetical protein HUJ04_010625 [Dendroctonus ponderosae]KAH1021065.1 hypothetical protein HUJ04_010625 [Dendroctonus ponderosae]